MQMPVSSYPKLQSTTLAQANPVNSEGNPVLSDRNLPSFDLRIAHATAFIGLLTLTLASPCSMRKHCLLVVQISDVLYYLGRRLRKEQCCDWLRDWVPLENG